VEKGYVTSLVIKRFLVCSEKTFNQTKLEAEIWAFIRRSTWKTVLYRKQS